MFACKTIILHRKNQPLASRDNDPFVLCGATSLAL
jgi:hypothetical protein